MQLRVGRVPVIIAGIALGLVVQAAHGEEIWTVRSGRTSLAFNTNMMSQLGIALSGVEETADASPASMLTEGPHWHFALTNDSSLRFRVDRGMFVAGGLVDGSLRHSGAFSIRDIASGRTVRIDDFGFDAADSPEGVGLKMGASEMADPFELNLDGTKFEFDRDAKTLTAVYLEMRVSPDLAAALGRPDLAGWLIATAEIHADAEMTGGVVSNEGPPESQEAEAGTFRDVKLGALNSISQVGHEGTFLSGAAALSMSTTSCNVGDVDVPWHAAMAEDHPAIAMSLYRHTQAGGIDRFEQIGVSDMKHGFFALSNSQCTPCQHPSDGSFLGVGCSDTYGVSNNADRTWLAPRGEWDPFAGTWTCYASHFAGGEPDCVRRHSGSAHSSSLTHRLVVNDVDLDNANSTYYYEGYYVVRADDNKINNSGSRECTMSAGGSSWNFSTPASGNPLMEGPAPLRWGDVQTWQTVTQDGQVLLCAKATPLGIGGAYRYEYALYNYDSDREIRRFEVPLGDASEITNIGFHDADLDDSDDWQGVIDGNNLVWEVDPYDVDPNAHALGFGMLFNFRFDADVPSQDGPVVLEPWKPIDGPGGQTTDPMAVASFIPQATVSVGDVAAARAALSLRNEPNPVVQSTAIRFDLANPGEVALEIFDPSGRRVRSVFDGSLPAGPQSVTWDGKGENGRRVRSGVYYYRLKVGDIVATRSLSILN